LKQVPIQRSKKQYSLLDEMIIPFEAIIIITIIHQQQQ